MSVSLATLTRLIPRSAMAVNTCTCMNTCIERTRYYVITYGPIAFDTLAPNTQEYKHSIPGVLFYNLL